MEIIRSLWLAMWFSPLALAQTEIPRHLNLAGLCDLTTELEPAAGRFVVGIAPAGDLDGDGKEDLLIREGITASDAGAVPNGPVVLLYGQPLPGGKVVIDDPAVRKTVIAGG